jgi:hypothetical protein
MQHENFLIAERALLGAFGNHLRDALRQRTNARVREKNFVAHDGKFALAQFFVRQNLGQGHAN